MKYFMKKKFLPRAIAVSVAPVLFLHGTVDELASDSISRYLYLDHWAYHYIDLFQDRGFMRELDRSDRPYRRADIALAIRDLRFGKEPMSDVELGWLNLLTDEFAEEIRSLTVREKQAPGYFVRGSVREDLDFERDIRNGDYYLSGEGAIRLPSLIFSSRVSVDQSLFDDSNYLGRKDLSIAGRVEDSYLLAGFSFVSVYFGRTERNWSPFPDLSLVLSENPFSYDHLYLRIGGKRLSLKSFFARLSDLPSGQLGVEGEERYFAAHRLDFRLGSWLQMGLFESAVCGGRGKGIDLSLLNPFTPYVVIENSTTRQLNSLFGFDIYLVPHPDLTISTQFLIDDVKLSLFGEPVFQGDEGEPNKFGLALGTTCADPLGLTGSLLRGRYLKVTNYTYNARDSLERYLEGGIGLGSIIGNDFDELMVSFDYFPVKSWTFAASTRYLRRGEGRISDPLPLEFESEDFPSPSGVVEKHFSLDISVRYQVSAAWFFRGGLGFIDTRNVDHAKGTDERNMRGSARLQVSWWKWFT
jgi:hypothetical protein